MIARRKASARGEDIESLELMAALEGFRRDSEDRAPIAASSGDAPACDGARRGSHVLGEPAESMQIGGVVVPMPDAVYLSNVALTTLKRCVVRLDYLPDPSRQVRVYIEDRG